MSRCAAATARDALKKQDCLYTLAIRDGDRQQLRVIGSVCARGSEIRPLCWVMSSPDFVSSASR